MESPLGGLAFGGDYYNKQEAMLNVRSQPATMKDRIDLAVKQAEEKLVAVKRARELFDKNPDLEELLNIMQRMHF